MALTEITAKKNENTATVTYDFGDNLEDAREKFGDEVVFSHFVSKAKITAQAAIRRYLESGVDEDTIQEKMQDWQPGVSLERTVDPVAAVMRKFSSMTADDQAALIESLKSQAA